MEKTTPDIPMSTTTVRQEHHGLFILQGESHERFLYADILYVEASRGYCYVYLKEGSKVIVVHPLGAIEQKLPAGQFMRVHRSYLLNLDHVNAFIGNSARVGKNLLPVSKHYRKGLFGIFDFLEKTPGHPEERENEE